MEKDSKGKGHKGLNDIIIASMKFSINEPNWEPDATGQPDLDRCIRDQSKIGWPQLYKGRIAKTITQYMERHYRTNNNDNWQYSGESWTRKLIQCLWDALLALWKQRNDIIHDTQLETKSIQQKRKLEARIDRCYTFHDELMLQDRSKIFYKSKEELLQEDPRYITAWLRISERIIRIHRKEKKKTTKERTMMEQYFKWHPPERSGKKVKPTARQRYSKNDLKPD
jgi:hypothetical protein